MHLVAVVHFYPGPQGAVWAGSETMIHTMLKYAISQGHRASVVTTQQPDAPDDYEIDGVRVVQSKRDPAAVAEATRKLAPDVILTHHQCTAVAVKTSLVLGVPSIQVIHNQRKGTEKYFRSSSDLYVFNTTWVQDYYSYFRRPSMVVHPPVDPEVHRTTPGDMITLVNLNKDKGSALFYQLARRMPDLKFLGVEGGHGMQILAPADNVEILPQTSNMKADVWARTKILLMPSVYESYGLAGVEAMVSGIPVIANSTPGLHESLSYAGTFVDRDDLDGWEKALRLTLKPSVWKSKSLVAKERVLDLDPEPELQSFLERVEALVSRSK